MYSNYTKNSVINIYNELKNYNINRTEKKKILLLQHLIFILILFIIG